MNDLPTLGFIGAGKVASALAPLAAQAGYRVASVYSSNTEHAAALADVVSARVQTSAAGVVQACDLTFMAVPDDVIAPLAQSVAEVLPAISIRKALVHTSGSRSTDVLQPLAKHGISVGSLHPAYPFTGGTIRSLRGVAFAIESGDAQLSDVLGNLVMALGGVSIAIAPGGKALYHAALVFASNYSVVLYAVAEHLLKSLAVDADAAKSALLPLMQGTLDNLAAQGVPDALPGPLVRGDVGTVQSHLTALSSQPEVLALYRALALAALPLAAARGVNTDLLRATINGAP